MKLVQKNKLYMFHTYILIHYSGFVFCLHEYSSKCSFLSVSYIYVAYSGPPSIDFVFIDYFAVTSPVFTQPPKNNIIGLYTKHFNYSLTCKADGASSYNWERQNNTIPSDSIGVNTNNLTLINLQPEDAGNYRCVATNASGSSVSDYATLAINGTVT